jgi:hypothetical protein
VEAVGEKDPAELGDAVRVGPVVVLVVRQRAQEVELDLGSIFININYPQGNQITRNFPSLDPTKIPRNFPSLDPTKIPRNFPSLDPTKISRNLIFFPREKNRPPFS